MFPMSASVQRLLRRPFLVEKSGVQVTHDITLRETEDFIHELEGKIIMDLLYGERKLGGLFGEPFLLGGLFGAMASEPHLEEEEDDENLDKDEQVVNLLSSALIKSTEIADPKARLLVISGAFDLYQEYIEKKHRKDLYDYFDHGFESDEEIQMKPPPHDVGEAAWTSVKQSVEVFAALVHGKANREIPKFKVVQSIARKFIGSLKTLIEQDDPCVLICFPLYKRRRLWEKTKVEIFEPDLEGLVQRFLQATGRDEDFDVGQQVQLFQQVDDTNDEPKFKKDLTFDEALKYVKQGGKFRRGIERIMNNGSGSFSIIRDPVYDTYFSTSEATAEVNDPVAVLAIHHGILLAMEDIRMLPPGDSGNELRKMFLTLEAALMKYVDMLESSRQAFNQRDRCFVKLLRQLSSGGAHHYIHTVFSQDGETNKNNCKELAQQVAKRVSETRRDYVLQIHARSGGIAGTSLAGDEVFSFSDLPARLDSDFVKNLIAKAIQVDIKCIEIYGGPDALQECKESALEDWISVSVKIASKVVRECQSALEGVDEFDSNSDDPDPFSGDDQTQHSEEEEEEAHEEADEESEDYDHCESDEGDAYEDP